MSFKSTRIVLLGKQDGSNNDSLNEILGSVFPAEVPKEFIYKINMYTEEGNCYELSPKKLSSNLVLDNPIELVNLIGKSHTYDVIEIVIDMSKVKKKLTAESHELLAKFLDNSK